MPELATYFPNDSGRRLFGILQIPATTAPRRVGVVFCHPIGEEKRVSYGVTVRFARFLADREIPSLRFDCQGFGDSEGNMIEVTVSSQVADVKTAISHLIREAQVSGVALVGVRFGATIARLVAESDDRVAALVLISPVVSGLDYWNTILRGQQMSFMGRGLKTPKREDLLRSLADSGQIEIKGEYFSSRFVDEMSKTDLLTTAGTCRLPHLVATAEDLGKEAAPLAQFMERCRREAGHSLDLLHLQNEFWTTNALYQDNRPEELFERTGDWLSGFGP